MVYSFWFMVLYIDNPTSYPKAVYRREFPKVACILDLKNHKLKTINRKRTLVRILLSTNGEKLTNNSPVPAVKFDYDDPFEKHLFRPCLTYDCLRM
jgi:hypothetical protein